MKKRVYNFKKAVEIAEVCDMPSVLSAALKDAALRLSILDANGTSVISEMQGAVLGACEFLDAIEVKTYQVKEVEQ